MVIMVNDGILLDSVRQLMHQERAERATLSIDFSADSNPRATVRLIYAGRVVEVPVELGDEEETP